VSVHGVVYRATPGVSGPGGLIHWRPGAGRRCPGPEAVWTESRIDATMSRVSGNSSAHHSALLRRHGLQVTAQRLAVLRAVADRPHLAADEAYQVVRAELGAISRQAVYDALAAFTASGLLRRIQPSGSPARYEHRVGDNHHHLICRMCNRVVDVDCAVGHAPCLMASDASGFEIDEAEVVYWGRCPECAGAAVDPGGAA
jgi:Fur family transcriptional regulator, stress-responsive regulator